MMLRSTFSFLTLTAFGLTALGAAPAQRNILGLVVDACVLNAAVTASPTPCLSVVRSKTDENGYAVLREPLDRQRTILAALNDITGIEDPRLLASNAPNFFASAWKERSLFLSKRDPQGFALAINPANSRSQDRLHVHMSCLEQPARNVLSKHAVAVNPNRFEALNYNLQKQALWAMRVTANDVAEFNPIQLLAERMPGARERMGEHLLIVVPETLPDGKRAFILMTNRPDPKTWHFSVERFLERTCD